MEEMKINLKISRNLIQGNQIKSAATQTMIVKHAFEVEKIGPKETKVSKSETKISASNSHFDRTHSNTKLIAFP